MRRLTSVLTDLGQYLTSQLWAERIENVHKKCLLWQVVLSNVAMTHFNRWGATIARSEQFHVTSRDCAQVTGPLDAYNSPEWQGGGAKKRPPFAGPEIDKR
jgi:hypothetical protein